MDPTLLQLRGELDAIDAELLALLARRRDRVAALFAHKAAVGLPRLDRSREDALLDARAADGAALGLASEHVRAVFRAVLAMSHALP